MGYKEGITAIAISTISATAGVAVFSNSLVTFGIATSVGSAIITASHAGITSQSNQVLTVIVTGNTTLASSGTINASAFIISAASSVSVGISGGSIVISR